MRFRMCFALNILIMLAGGAFSPPVSWAVDYLLFATEDQGTRCRIYRLDGSGNITFQKEHQVGWDSANITPSYDGRLVIVSGWNHPMMSAFFIENGGSLDAPLYLDNPIAPGLGDGHYNPVAFHSQLSLFYIGFKPITAFHYSLTRRIVEATSQSLAMSNLGYPSYTLGYSTSYKQLVFIKHLDVSAVQTVHINDDGSFGQINPALRLTTTMNADFAVSPDGRWAAATNQAGGAFNFIHIDGDSTPTLVNPFPNWWPGDEPPEPEIVGFNNLAFTADSQHLMVVSSAPHALLNYQINQETGELTRLGDVAYNAPGWTMKLPLNLTISCDDRYAVFRAVNPNNAEHNLLHVVRIHEDGTLEYLPGKEVDVGFYISALCLVPITQNAATDWMMYE